MHTAVTRSSGLHAPLLAVRGVGGTVPSGSKAWEHGGQEPGAAPSAAGCTPWSTDTVKTGRAGEALAWLGRAVPARCPARRGGTQGPPALHEGRGGGRQLGPGCDARGRLSGRSPSSAGRAFSVAIARARHVLLKPTGRGVGSRKAGCHPQQGSKACLRTERPCEQRSGGPLPCVLTRTASASWSPRGDCWLPHLTS